MEKYELIRHIGRPRQGNCAALMLAQERDSSKIYAVKVVSLSQLGIEGYSRGTLESALKEVEMFSDLSHPFIVNCRRTFVEGGQLYIVLDYADGGDLHGRIVRMRAKHSLFDESTILRWFVQLCLAVNFLHEKNIVHRDIQSRNVFLDGHDPGSVKLGDIAIPRVLQNRQDLASTSVATSGYVSPGTCEERPYSFKSDVWSLGCILYELACLELPFDGASVQAAVGSIGKRQFNSVNPKYSEATAKLIEEMLSDDPGKRPTTAQILSRPHLQSHLQLILREKKLITAPPAPESSERDRIRQIQNELLGFHGTLHVLKSQGPSCRHLEAEEADAVPSPLSSIPPLQFTGSDMPLTQATQTCDSPGDEQSGKIEWNLQQETPTNVADSFSVPVHNGVPRSDGTRNAAEDVKRESSKQKEQSLRHHEEELSNIRQQYQRDRWRLAEKHRQRIERSYEYNADTNEPDKAKQRREAAAPSVWNLLCRRQRRLEHQIGLRRYVAKQRELLKRESQHECHTTRDFKSLHPSRWTSLSWENQAPGYADPCGDLHCPSMIPQKSKIESEDGGFGVPAAIEHREGCEQDKKKTEPHRISEQVLSEGPSEETSYGRGEERGAVILCRKCAKKKNLSAWVDSNRCKERPETSGSRSSPGKSVREPCSCRSCPDTSCRLTGSSTIERSQTVASECHRRSEDSSVRTWVETKEKHRRRHEYHRSETTVKSRTVIRQGQVMNGENDLRTATLRRLDNLKGHLVKALGFSQLLQGYQFLTRRTLGNRNFLMPLFDTEDTVGPLYTLPSSGECLPKEVVPYLPHIHRLIMYETAIACESYWGLSRP